MKQCSKVESAEEKISGLLLVERGKPTIAIQAEDISKKNPESWKPGAINFRIFIVPSMSNFLQHIITLVDMM